MKFVVFLALLFFGCSTGDVPGGNDGDVVVIAQPDSSTDQTITPDMGEDSSPDLTTETPINVAGWNLESGDSDIDLLVEYIEASPDIHLWGLSEVSDAWAIPLRDAASSNGRNFRYSLGQSGGADRLLLLFDQSRFDLLEIQELTEINIDDEVRAPLVALLQDRQSGQRFSFMVNHLYRTSDPGRHEQARLLNDWVSTQTDPVIAVGDYNFDWDLPDGDNDHDLGYDLMTADGRWIWVRPETLVRTQCGSSFNSVLDFIFVNPLAFEWNGVSTIAESSPSFCDVEPKTDESTDDGQMSDHIPILGTFYPPPAF